MNRIKSFWSFLTAPVSRDPDQERRQYMTTVVIVVMCIIVLPLLVITFIGWMVGIIPLDTVIILLVMNALLFSGLLIIKNKKMWRPSAHLPVALVLFSALYGNHIGGMGAPAVIIYILAIMMAGILLGRKTQWFVTVICILFYLLFAIGEHYGFLLISRTNETMFLNRISIAVATIIAISSLLHFLINQFESAFEKAKVKQDEVYDLAMKNLRLYDESQKEMSERIKADEALRNSLREKEVLLKEIHHRVKNNLNVIVSLLGLQSEQEQHEAARDSLNVTKNRIYAISLIHELLYRMDDLANIDFGFYIEELVRQLHGVYLTDGKNITEMITVKNVELDITRAVPCGILINEVLTNVYKHAFIGRDQGNIVIEMSRSGDVYSLFIGDDGIGLPDEKTISGRFSLGMELIRLLATTQLRGELSCWNDNGVKYRIVFPVSAYASPGNPAS